MLGKAEGGGGGGGVLRRCAEVALNTAIATHPASALGRLVGAGCPHAGPEVWLEEAEEKEEAGGGGGREKGRAHV